ncbi:SusC/RagA family TonB-linked outer membrane protein [Pleomorphovibrio marinus]|uniref:SusC/RagA family TonB-linked outer membrane protein n=1 Tax=Pleomorphovibrio marinus TaxID=2164132 RepID=UPI000E0AD42A|nr:SusC/RagA family TonB-linked outer membrane protein [Pleomorphovibrio marinus]
MKKSISKGKGVFFVLCCCLLFISGFFSPIHATENSINRTALDIGEFDITITGVVTDENGEPLPGASILLEGSTTGTVTDIDGNYSLTVPDDSQTLIVSYVGYQQQRVQIGGRSEINVQLSPDAEQLSEVVVTAFGLKREERSLGHAVGKVDTDQLAQNPEINVANSLSGRVAGVQVDGAGGADGSSRVVIRGFSSLGGNNQPLYVVDGIPIDNTSRVQAGRWGGRDGGDGIQNLNPNDIEEMSVLKGPNAAALYGERGANGVIMITTKSGASRDGIGVEINSNMRVGNPLVWPDFQNEYGLGSNGQHRYFSDGQGNIFSRSEAQAMGNMDQLTPQVTTNRDGPQHPKSWGPRMDGHTVYGWDGEMVPFSPQPNNVRDFFQNQLTFDNSVSLSGGNETSNFRLSVGDIRNRGMQPSNNLTRNTFNIRAEHKFNERLTVSSKVNYVRQSVENRVGLADDQRNAIYQFRGLPRNTSLESFQRYELTQGDLDNPNALHDYLSNQRQVGWSRHWSNGTHTENPYWITNNVRNEDRRERVMAFMDIHYQINDWLSTSLLAGTDFYTDNRHTHDAIGTRVNQIGGMSETTQQFREDNVQFLLMANKKLTDDLDFSANIGGNYMRNDFQNSGFDGSRLSVPNLYVITNAAVQNPILNIQQREIQSVFAFGQLGWRDYLYLDWSIRNDWSSTLPEQNNSFMYPAISSNFVWTDAFDFYSSTLSYGSLRASWAQAGNSADPYNVLGVYNLTNNPHLGQPGAVFQNTVPFSDLQSELTSSWEIGADLRFFEGRLRLDATWYHASTVNQILNIAVAPSSGFANRSVNAGEIVNTGVEVMIDGVVVEREDLMWSLNLNVAHNYNEVVSLVDGIDRFMLGDSRNVRVYADPGQPYGAIYSPIARWLRDDDGNRIVGQDGLPVRENGEFRIGNVMPLFTGGFSSTLNYKNWTLFTLFDMRYGGDIFSLSNVYEALYGTTTRTLEGRDGTYIADGVVGVQNEDGQWVSTGEPNTTQISAEQYWNHVVPAQDQSVGEEFLNSSTFVKMRELRLGYNFPRAFTERLGVNQLNLSFVGQNLFYFVRHTDGFSPEVASFNLGQEGMGIESFAWPLMRNLGFNIRIAF